MSNLAKNYNRKKISFKYGKGSFLYSANGKKYLYGVAPNTNLVGLNILDKVMDLYNLTEHTQGSPATKQSREGRNYGYIGHGGNQMAWRCLKLL